MPVPSRSVISCPPKLRPLALRQLHSQLPADQQGVLAQALERIDVRDPQAWEGLLIAVVGGAEGVKPDPESVGGVAWVQRLPGNTAVLWMPPKTGVSGAALLDGVAKYVDASRLPLTQMVVGEHDGYSATMQQQGGFPRFAELLYLYAEISNRPQTPRQPGFDAVAEPAFVGGAGDDPERLSQVLEQTYVGTFDCPGLDGVRAMPDVLEGYRAQGRYSADDWYIVTRRGVDVGALILAEHVDTGNWELVYMGLVPAARNQGIGEKIVHFALDVAAERGAERLILAVDKQNMPALAVYRRMGFVEWDRRIVYARLQPRL